MTSFEYMLFDFDASRSISVKLEFSLPPTGESPKPTPYKAPSEGRLFKTKNLLIFPVIFGSPAAI